MAASRLREALDSFMGISLSKEKRAARIRAPPEFLRLL
jgi:hypothetical protein